MSLMPGAEGLRLRPRLRLAWNGTCQVPSSRGARAACPCANEEITRRLRLALSGTCQVPSSRGARAACPCANEREITGGPPVPLLQR